LRTNARIMNVREPRSCHVGSGAAGEERNGEVRQPHDQPVTHYEADNSSRTRMAHHEPPFVIRGDYRRYKKADVIVALDMAGATRCCS